MPDNRHTDTSGTESSNESGTDIIDQIDALTTDAARWTATAENGTPGWNTPAEGTMAAVLLTMAGAQIVEISRTEPDADLSGLIGDPLFDCIHHLYGVDIWVGGNSVNTAPVNTGATQFLHRLLRAVRDGDYVASDREREHVRRLLDDPSGAPVIHGPALITGVDSAGEPTELDENFQAWFTKVVEQIDGIRHMVAHVVGHAVAEFLGIPADQIGQVVVVGLT